MFAVVITGEPKLESGPPPRAGRRAKAQHVRGLDGIRAFAVLAVLGFHGGVSWLSGGNLGVDIFFVLSGYLITSLLVGEWNRSSTIRFGAFYARRARRLVPALLVLMALIAVYGAYFVESDTLSTLRGDAFSTMAYVANWRFIFSHQSYFQHFGPPSPLLHTWSLAVEEQFYLVWPAVALFTLRRFGRRGLGWVALVAALGSAALTAALSVAGVSATQLYYGTQTRVQEVMVGALLAICAPAVRRWCSREGGGGTTVISVCGWAGALGLLWAVHAVDGSGGFLYHGGFLVIAICAVAVIALVVERPEHPVSWVLGLGVVGYIGRISYGLYLYHYPIFLILDGERTGLANFPLLALRLAVTGAMAVASYHLIELPVRERRLISRRAVSIGGVVSVAIVVVALVVATEPVAPAPVHISAAAKASLTAEPAHPPAVLVNGKQVRVLLLGDSLALTLGMGLGVHAQKWGIDFFDNAVLGCDIDPGATVNIEGTIGPTAPGCVGWPATWKHEIATIDPDVVALELGRWEVSDRLIDGKWSTIGQPAWDKRYTAELTKAINILSAKGAHIVLFTLPYIAQTTDAPNGQPWNINEPGRTVAYNALIARIAAKFAKKVSIIDVNKLLDPKGVYTSYIDGIRVRNSDDEHVSVPGGEYLRPVILPQLFELGVDRALARPSTKGPHAPSTGS